MSQGPDNLPKKRTWCSKVVISKNKSNLFVMIGDFIIVYLTGQIWFQVNFDLT